MKKLILISFAIIIVIALTGCSNESHSNETNLDIDCTEYDHTTTENDLPLRFESEEVLKEELTSSQDKRIQGLDQYFAPNAIPNGASFEMITAKDFYITFHYSFTEKPDPYMENTFTFTWNKTMKTGDAKADVYRLYDEEEIEVYNDFYIVKAKSWDDYAGDKEYVCQVVFWEHDGNSFNAVVPITFTKDDITKYCVAKEVKVN